MTIRSHRPYGFLPGKPTIANVSTLNPPPRQHCKDAFKRPGGRASWWGFYVCNSLRLLPFDRQANFISTTIEALWNLLRWISKDCQPTRSEVKTSITGDLFSGHQSTISAKDWIFVNCRSWFYFLSISINTHVMHHQYFCTEGILCY